MRLRILAVAMLGMLLVSPAGGSAATRATVVLRQCGQHPLVECGSIVVPLYRLHPGVGRPLTVHFRIYHHLDQSSPAGVPVVAFEGGPGYPSIGSASTYLFMLGSLHQDHDLIVMDQRGTGTSDPIRCPDLQNGVGNYVRATAACARRLGVAANAFGSAAVADDLAAILHGLDVPRVDVYGDSYGTYAAQVFTVHHPHLVRAVVLDGTYDNSFRPFEPEGSVSLRHAWTALCRRAKSCPGILGSIGAFDRHLAAHPLIGRGRDADGFVERVHLTPAGFAQLVFDATYTYTVFRDLPGALRAYRHGDRAPMLRLAAEDVSFNAAGGNAAGYSVGDLEAVSCHDYPTVWNVAAGIPNRRAQLNHAIATLPADVFAPFSKRVWLNSAGESELVRGCLEWPVPKYSDPPFPSASRPHVPVLVIDGEFDQTTPVGDARKVAATWPDSTYVQMANTGHISALDDFQRCASGLVRTFLTSLDAGDTACAARIPAIAAIRFPAELAAAPVGHALPGNRAEASARRAAWVANTTVGDALSRWYNLMFGVVGHGLRSGTFTPLGPYASYAHPLVIRFRGDRFVSGLAVSGRAIWNRTALRVRATLSLRGPTGASGRITLSFPTSRAHGRAIVTGTVGGRHVHLRLDPPWTSEG
ncbi:MAG: alpha/beta fold hydrolase [Gaiellales bacterium]